MTVDDVCWTTIDDDEEMVGWTISEGMPPVEATEEATSVEVATDEGDAIVGVTVSLATLPVDATEVAAAEVGTDVGSVEGWISELATFSVEDAVS